ncbi:hypothetical protein [Sinomonas humi]|nr:hypothetical protein [Sinomonas humi]
MDAPAQKSLPQTSGATPPHLSRDEVAPDPEAWPPGAGPLVDEPLESGSLPAETARRLGEVDVEACSARTEAPMLMP